MRVCARCKTEYADDVTICPADGSQTKPKGADTGPATDALLGRMVGSYRLIKQLGKGGMGAVYMGEHPAIGSKVAVKFLHPQYATMNEVVTRFFNEAKAVNLIKHDNIVQVVDYFYLDDQMPCFIMEYLDRGYSMTKLVGRPNPLSITGPILVQMCDALAAAHDKKIVHRDLKPDNIFLAVRNGRKHFVKVMDFGIAKLSNSGEGGDLQTQLGQVLGTPAYMSPEQASGKVDQIGPASDIYSLGMIMYQLAVGRVPFRGAMGEIIAAHLKDTPPPPRSEIPAIPVAYEALILKAVAKKPEERFASMRDLAQAILGVMRDLGIPAELPVDDGEGSGSDFVPSSSLSPYPTREGRPSNVPTSAASGPSLAGTSPAGRSVEESGPTNYGNKGTASGAPDASGPTSYPNLPSAPAALDPAGATNYGSQGPAPAADPAGATNYGNSRPAAVASASAPAASATGYPAAPAAPTTGPTQPHGAAAPVPTMATAVPTLITVSGAAAKAAIASPAVAPQAPVPQPVSAPAPRSSRLMVAGVAFVLGIATPIALVKGGVVSLHAKK